VPFPDNVGLHDVLNYLPVKVSSPEIPPGIASVIERAVAPDAEDRWPSMYAFSSMLIDTAQQLGRAAPQA
jgi:hypothetical protein